ncbi:MAG: NfeD family protein [Clostridium sp.]|jgi:membrane protein implicated in regulation of membrane protease activity|nr:NfeD family protein [Clostridium sp.]
MQQILFWLVLFIFLLGIEALTLGLTTVWFAIAALVATAAAALGAPLPIQIGLFFLIALELLLVTRPIALRYFNKGRLRTNAESLVGRQAIVTSDIDNIMSGGQVMVGGQEWSARSVEEKGKIASGELVRILSISGVKLIVGKVPEAEAEPETVLETKPEPETVLETKPEPETVPEAEPEGKAQREPETEPYVNFVLPVPLPPEPEEEPKQ